MTIWRSKYTKKENQIFIPNIFQSEALKEIDKAILDNEKSFLIVMPPATGKTYLAAQWFKLQLKKNPKARLLYVCHNQDILSQANDKEFENCLSEFDIPRGYYNRSEKNIGQVTFATVQTLRRNLHKLPSDYFDYIIVDEAHHYRANSFERAIKHFSPKVLLGLTATPYRMDGKSILDVFGKIIYNASISNGIKNGLLSKIKYYFVDNDIDFSEIKYNSRGNYDEKDLNKKICIKEYDDAIIKEYIETVKHKHNKIKTICFCATVEHVYRMEKLFNDNGIKTIALAAKRYNEKGKEVTVHDSRRKQIIDNFRKGDYDIIFVRDLFNEGMDIPDADCIIMLRPTESSRIFTQQIGRGLRISKEKNYLLTLDFTGNCYRCNINYEVLNEIMELDIEKDVKDKIRGDNNPSEIIIQNIGCEVRLSKRKIDLIKESEEKIKTKERLIENYFSVKNKLGRQPTSEDFNKSKNDFSSYSISSYLNFFGTWNNFLKSINEKYISMGYLPTEKELIDNYLEVKNKLGRQPLEREMRLEISLFGESKYLKHFGSWFNFLSKVGDVPLDYISEDDLIENYLNIKRELNRVPYGKNIGKYGKFCLSTYVKRFGSWKKFLQKMGEKTKNIKNISGVTEKDLIENYFDIKNNLNKIPKCSEMDIYGKFGCYAYFKIFGSWNKFLQKIGDKIKYIINEKDLIENYFDVKNKLNKVPTCVEMDKYGKIGHHKYDKRYGSWNKFLKKIGEEIRHRMNIAEEELIKNYFNVKNKLDKVPTFTEMDKYGEFCGATYTDRYGSWNKFLKKIGDKINRKKIIEEDLIKNYWDLKSKYPDLTQEMMTKKNGSLFNLSVYVDRFGSWNKFLATIGEKIRHRMNITEEDLIRNYKNLKNKYPGLTSNMISKKNGSEFDVSTYHRHFGSWKKFLEFINEQPYIDEKCKKNIIIIPDYAPKNPLPDLKFGKSNKKSSIDTGTLLGHKYNGGINKDNIRRKIIEKIQDGDIVLMLESPELDTLKEIEKQGKNPKKIIIPNHFEFNDLATALKGYNTNLNIEVINTSVLQYLADHIDEHLNFLWLDYCGAFSYYTRDLDIVFKREIIDLKLILTYNVFDPKKQDDTYYFANVVGYVLKKLRGKNEILLMEDVSQRYKKTMFSVGFDIKILSERIA